MVYVNSSNVKLFLQFFLYFLLLKFLSSFPLQTLKQNLSTQYVLNILLSVEANLRKK